MHCFFCLVRPSSLHPPSQCSSLVLLIYLFYLFIYLFCLSYSTLSSLEEGAMSVLITIIPLASNTGPGTQYMFTKLTYMYAVDP